MAMDQQQKKQKNQTDFVSEHYINELAELYIDEENDNEVENYNQGKTLSITRNDINYYSNNRIREEDLNKQQLDVTEIELEEEEVEEDLSQPFPIPKSNDTLDRTSLLDLTSNKDLSNKKKDYWNILKNKMENDPKLNRTESKNESNDSTKNAWSSILKMVKSVPTNTKLSLGIDSSKNLPNISSTGVNTTNNKASTSGTARSLKSSVDNAVKGGASNTQALNNTSPMPIYKTLNNWNERTFRVLNNNMIFGGKIKEKKLDKYLDNLNEDYVDITDPFLYYKHREKSGQEIDLSMSNRISVANIAMNGVKKILMIRDPAQDFEQPFLNSEIDEIPKKSNYGARRLSNEEYGMDEVDTEDNGVRTKQPESGVDNVEGPWDAFMHTFSQRKFGLGFCDRLCDNFLSPSKVEKYQDLLKLVKQHRPYFTYWVTFVQIVVCIVSLIAYGLAPIGISSSIKRGLATTINLEKQSITFPVKDNFWIGPAAMDLIHLGAKYAPCMRNDSNIYNAIKEDRLKEKESACCIRNDRGGCVQTNKESCSELFSRFDKWNSSTHKPGIGHIKRNSGSVCGQDPEFCSDIESNKWPDDITKWPKCEKPTAIVNSFIKENEHMHCEIIGRPCCIGIQGECIITTDEHCSLMRGYFHGNAHLCSQVDCMQDVCGMIDFLHVESPDQVYRLFTSIFIHAGIIQLLFTIVFQILILRDIEKLAGCLRVAIIYTASGVIGNLGSAIFLPYQAEVGPMGAQFGIYACTFVETFHVWDLYEKPWWVITKMVGFLLLFIALGFLPMIDNFANVFGFLSGLLLSSILFPNIDLKGKCKRVVMVAIAVSIIVVVFGALVILFYIKPIDECNWCKILSCPFNNKYCFEFDFNIKRISKFMIN